MALLPRSVGRLVKNNNSLDVAIWGGSIRPELWIEMYEFLSSTNECSFKIYFCGHINPNFELPENFIHIYSEMLYAPCAELARRHALASEARYLTLFVDDMKMSEGILDTLIAEIEKCENELVVGPGFRPTLPGQRGSRGNTESGLINTDESQNNQNGDRGIMVVFPTMRRSTAIKMGGIDKRFQGVYWDYDLLARLHLCEGIKFKTLSHIEIAEDMSVQYNTYDRQRSSRRWGPHDMCVLRSIWDGDRNNLVRYPVKQLSEIQEWKDEELGFLII